MSDESTPATAAAAATTAEESSASAVVDETQAVAAHMSAHSTAMSEHLAASAKNEGLDLTEHLAAHEAKLTPAEEAVPPVVEDGSSLAAENEALRQLEKELEELKLAHEALKDHVVELTTQQKNNFFAARKAESDVAAFLEATEMNLPIAEITKAGWTKMEGSKVTALGYEKFFGLPMLGTRDFACTMFYHAGTERFAAAVPDGVFSARYKVRKSCTNQGRSLTVSDRPEAGCKPRFKALSKGVIRAGVDKKSEKVGDLPEGTVIEVLSTEEVGDTTRVQFDRGWVSMTGGSGQALLEPLPVKTPGQASAESESLPLVQLKVGEKVLVSHIVITSHGTPASDIRKVVTVTPAGGAGEDLAAKGAKHLAGNLAGMIPIPGVGGVVGAVLIEAAKEKAQEAIDAKIEGAVASAAEKIKSGEAKQQEQPMLLTVTSTAQAAQAYLFVEKVTSGQNKRTVKGYIEAQNLVAVPPKMTVIKDTIVRDGPEMRSQRVLRPQTSDGAARSTSTDAPGQTKLQAGSVITVAESAWVTLADGKVRVKYEKGWVNLDSLQPEGTQGTLGPERVSMTVKTDLLGAKLTACTWLAEECSVYANWLSMLTSMRSEGTLLGAIGIEPAPAPETERAAVSVGNGKEEDDDDDDDDDDDEEEEEEGLLEPEPEPQSEPELQPAAEPEPEYSGLAHVQYSGKGDFRKVWLSLTANEELALKKENADGKVLRSIDVQGCSLAQPKSARKGHENALRVDTSKDDAKGDKKYIISVATGDELSKLRDALGAYGKEKSAGKKSGRQ